MNGLEVFFSLSQVLYIMSKVLEGPKPVTDEGYSQTERRREASNINDYFTFCHLFFVKVYFLA